jgi:hypothetical protein
VAKRRRVFFLVAGFTSGLGLAAACSFPDPVLVPDEGGTVPDGALDDGGVRPDITEPDAPPPIDATSEKPAVDANCNPCDCDGDGYTTQDAAVCPGDAGPRLDCDDLDDRANPGSGFRKDLPTLDTRGDWNCDGITRREIPQVNINCANYNGLATGCGSVEGFTGNPGCGEKMTYVKCGIENLTTCVAKDTFDEVMGCQ